MDSVSHALSSMAGMLLLPATFIVVAPLLAYVHCLTNDKKFTVGSMLKWAAVGLGGSLVAVLLLLVLNELAK